MESYPLGINFGPSHITAAYITKDGKPITLASVVGSDEYQTLIENSIINEGVKIQRDGEWYIRDGESLLPSSPDTHGNPEAEMIITSTLKEFRDKALNTSIDLTSISVPQHFNETTCRAFVNCALELEPGMVRPWQIRRYYNAMRLAYHLNSCEGFGISSLTCHIEDGPHLILFIDYNDAYLEFYIADVGEFIFGEIAKKTMKGYGANRLAAISSKDMDVYWGEIRKEFENFVAKHFDPQNAEDLADEHLRAIVLNGDAPIQAFHRIRNVVVKVLPASTDKVRDTIDPLYVGAVGAAEWAKLQVRIPRMLRDTTAQTIIHDPPAHVEL